MELTVFMIFSFSNGLNLPGQDYHLSYDFPVKVFFLAHWCTSYQSLIFLGFGTLHWMCWAHPFYLLIPPLHF